MNEAALGALKAIQSAMEILWEAHDHVAPTKNGVQCEGTIGASSTKMLLCTGPLIQAGPAHAGHRPAVLCYGPRMPMEHRNASKIPIPTTQAVLYEARSVFLCRLWQPNPA